VSKKFSELNKAQKATAWILMAAVIADFTTNALAWFDARRMSRNWDKAIAEDLEKVKDTERESSDEHSPS
jgi:hypothetical protein